MLYEILKTSKLGASFAPDMYTALWAQKLARDGEVKTLSGAPPLSFKANGTPLLDYLLSGNTAQSGTPSPDSPVIPEGCGVLETSGAKAGQYKIPILSNSTTTPVYLGEVESTRKIKKLVLDGTENWSNTTNSVYIASANLGGIPTPVSNSPLVCTHLPNNTSGMTQGGNWYFRSYYTASVQDWKTYLAQQYAAGTPVTVWYVLATEETAVVNEPLMKIGEYADTVSMEQAGVEIPTARGMNTLDVLTDVKPSEVYIKYKE